MARSLIPWWKWFTAVSSGPCVGHREVTQSHYNQWLKSSFNLRFVWFPSKNIGRTHFIQVYGSLISSIQFIQTVIHRFNSLNSCREVFGLMSLDCSMLHRFQNVRLVGCLATNPSVFLKFHIVYTASNPAVIRWVTAERYTGDTTRTTAPSLSGTAQRNRMKRSIQSFITVGADRRKETMALLNLFHYGEIVVCYLPDLIHTVNKLLGKWWGLSDKKAATSWQPANLQPEHKSSEGEENPTLAKKLLTLKWAGLELRGLYYTSAQPFHKITL